MQRIVGHFGGIENHLQLSIGRQTETGLTGLMVADALDAIHIQNVKQTFINIYLAIAIIIIRIAHRGIGLTTGSFQNALHILGGERRTGLQPQGDGTSHNRRRHGGASTGIPTISATIELEMGHIVARIPCVGILFNVIAAISRYHIHGIGRDVGFHTIVERRSNGGCMIALAVLMTVTAVMHTRLSAIIDD